MYFNPVSEADCIPIQCDGSKGTMQQKLDCANAGYAGVRSPLDPLCGGYQYTNPPVVMPPAPFVAPADSPQPLNTSPAIVQPPSTPLTIPVLAAVGPKLPTITGTKKSPCPADVVGTDYTPDGMDKGDETWLDTLDSYICAVGNWAHDNPVLAAGAVLVVYFAASEGTKRRAGRKA